MHGAANAERGAKSVADDSDGAGGHGVSPTSQNSTHPRAVLIHAMHRLLRQESFGRSEMRHQSPVGPIQLVVAVKYSARNDNRYFGNSASWRNRVSLAWRRLGETGRTGR
jgi:hypothetical protein